MSQQNPLNESLKIMPQHFEPMQLLGTGSFGEVYLVRKKSSGVFYAMKV
jgi:serine/threonine protein kinase